MRAPLLLALLLAGLLLAALAAGDRPAPVGDLLAALLSRPGASPQLAFILHELRLPRALMAALIGAGLGLAGTLAQAAMRNPLAEPGLLGINGGAALAALLVMVAIPGVAQGWLPLAAFAGAIAMAALIQALATRVGFGSQRIILIGVGLGAMTGGAASFISAFGEITAVQRALIWLSGSLQDAPWPRVRLLALWLLPAALAARLAARALDLLAHEDAVARGLGLRTRAARGAVLGLCALIAAAAVAAAGPVAFIGLMAPHIGRRLAGPAHGRLLPVAALAGACLLLAADTAGRVVVAPAQIPAGVVSALMGAPFFGWLMWWRRDA